jgi:electron transport complex protein RnfB
MCVKVCPAKAVKMEDDVVSIDHKVCMDFGPECKEICVEKCPRGIFRYFQPSSRASTKEAISA